MNKGKFTYKTILAVFFLLLTLVGIPLGVFLIKQHQEIRKKAAVPGGEATVSLSPPSGSYQIGQSFPVSIFFKTANVSISGVAIRITYPYNGSTPELTASGIQINPSLLTTGDWSCPVKTITPEGGIIKIDIACLNTNIAGFATSTETLLASFNLIANQIPATNPTILSFDPTQSIITRKSDGQDTLLIPTSTGSYTITLQTTPTPTRTPIPTATRTPIPIQTPTSSPTPSPTMTLTPSPTPIPTPTPNPACRVDLDQSGTIEANDLRMILAKWGQTCSGCLEDINEDGKINNLDTSLVISFWGQNCNW